MLLNILYRCIECWEIHNMMPQDTKLWKPPMFFLLIYSYINIAFHCTLWFSLSKKQKLLQDICFILIENYTWINRLGNRKIFDPILNHIAVIFWAIIFGIVGLVHFSSDAYELFSNKLTFLDCLKIFFNGNVSSNSNVSICDALYGLLVILGFIMRQIAGFFEEFFVTIIIIAVWIKTSSFLHSIKYQIHNDKTWEFIKRNYSSAKRMADTANSVIQNNLFLHTAVVLFSYTFQFSFHFGAQTYLTNNSKIHKIRFAVFLANSILMYYLAADIHHQVKHKVITII